MGLYSFSSLFLKSVFPPFKAMFPFPPTYGKHPNAGGMLYPSAAPMYNHHQYPPGVDNPSGENSDLGGGIANRDLKSGWRIQRQKKIRNRKDKDATKQLSLTLQSLLVRDLKIKIGHPVLESTV